MEIYWYALSPSVCLSIHLYHCALLFLIWPHVFPVTLSNIVCLKRKAFQAAQEILQYAWKNKNMSSKCSITYSILSIMHLSIYLFINNYPDVH